MRLSRKSEFFYIVFASLVRFVVKTCRSTHSGSPRVFWVAMSSEPDNEDYENDFSVDDIDLQIEDILAEPKPSRAAEAVSDASPTLNEADSELVSSSSSSVQPVADQSTPSTTTTANAVTPSFPTTTTTDDADIALHDSPPHAYRISVDLRVIRLAVSFSFPYFVRVHRCRFIKRAFYVTRMFLASFLSLTLCSLYRKSTNSEPCPSHCDTCIPLSG